MTNMTLGALVREFRQGSISIYSDKKLPKVLSTFLTFCFPDLTATKPQAVGYYFASTNRITWSTAWVEKEGTRCVNLSEIEPLLPDQLFKVGDKVKVIRTGPFRAGHTVSVDKVLTIKSFYNRVNELTNGAFNVTFTSGEDAWTQEYYDSFLELVPEIKYVAPTALYSGRVLEGTVFKLNGDYYVTEDMMYVMPSEIVETWQKFSPNTEVLVQGHIVVIGKGMIASNGSYFDRSQLASVYQNAIFHRPLGEQSDYHATFDSIKIGCTSFTPEQLKDIIDLYDKINK